MILGKYSFGIGDRFTRQGKALLAAVIEAKKQGVDITPVWNKSHREHTIIGTQPMSVRTEAEQAVGAMSWKGSYFVDADHIGLKNVDLFIKASDFFTLDVADFIGRPADEDEIRKFVGKFRRYSGTVTLAGSGETLDITERQIEMTARKYLYAARQAGEIYHHIESVKGAGNFITEVSMDETDAPQTPVEMLFILAAIAGQQVPVQTIAPKFTGRFNKGVDYIGDVARFAKEFEQHLGVIAVAVKEFGLAKNLKLSVHSGSDKFAIYGAINKAIKRFGAGLHVKTAGTTWLEELAGLALAGGDGPAIAKQIYREAFSRLDELCKPYATVIDIKKERLPEPAVVEKWTGEELADAMRHNQKCRGYNRDLRQLLHIGYKIAAEMGTQFTDAIEKYEQIIAANVTENIYERHIKPIFIN